MSKKKKREAKTTQPPQKTVSRAASNNPSQDVDLLFGRKNYMYLLIGVVLIVIGYFLMAGGHMPSADVWDESLIYSTTRTVIAPIFILAGLGIQVYTIFSKK